MIIEMEPIGKVRGSRSAAKDDYWGGSESSIELDERFGPEALDGIEEFSHAEVIFCFDRVDPAKIVMGAWHPRGNPEWPAVGIFAQRKKERPNRIGSTVCRIAGREGRTLIVAELDAIDGTPVLDIKPVMREFLPKGEIRQPAWVAQLMESYWATDQPS